MAQIRLRQFRGVPGELTLDFTLPGATTPGSLLLLGENGSGKSSIVDAIEFVLQARIGRERSLIRPEVSSPRSYATHGDPEVEAELSDKSKVSRTIRYDSGTPAIVSVSAHPHFSFAAFALRRADIVRFLDTSEDERQLMFLDYVGGRRGGSWAGSADDEKRLFELRREDLKSAIRSELAALGEQYAWQISDSVLDAPSFNALLKRKVYKGFDPEVAAARGIRIRLKPGAKERIAKILELMSQYKSTLTELRGVRKLGSDFKQSMNTLRRVLSGASDALTLSFKAISPAASFVERLSLEMSEGEQFALRVRVQLINGGTCAPKQVLSEANQDLLALLIFVALIEEAHHNGQAPVLILDDVLQSVDHSVRVAVVEHMLDRFAAWQLIITTHDRLWHAQLKSLFQRSGHAFNEAEILHWSFGGGPVLGGVRNDDAVLLSEAMERGDVTVVCAIAGLLHEAIADKLSWTLPIAVTRRQGDRYTLGDLWPGLFKLLKRSSIGPATVAADRWVHLRNLAGAHYNEWARSLSRHEAHAYGKAVLGLLEVVRCAKCHRWIERHGTAERWSCRCGGASVSIWPAP